MKSWYSRVTDTVEQNRTTVNELRDFMTRADALQIAQGSKHFVSAAKRRAKADIETQPLDLLEIQAAEMAAQQLEQFCAVLPFMEVV